jgi:hypothetical protein
MRICQVQDIAAALGRDTHGVVTAEELRVGGADRAVITRLVDDGRWRRLARGLYLTVPGPLTEVVKAHAAVKHAGPGAVLTGLLAARWLGLRWVPDPTAVQVLVPADRRRHSSEAFVLVRRHAGLEMLPTSTHEGLPVAPVAKVVVDAARELHSLQDVRGVVLAAVADGLCTTEQIRSVLAAGAVAGTKLVRRACLDAERGAVSPPEAELVDGLLPLGVPFYCNCEVWLGEELLGIVDVWLVGTGVGGELDSKQFHADALRLDATLLRDKRFHRATLSLQHISPLRYRSAPGAFHATLLGEVAAREAAGLPEPAGLRLVPRGPLLGLRPEPARRRRSTAA